MTAATNTSPLNYLILIGEAELLPQLFQAVLAPQAVIDELLHPGAPDAVRSWAAQPPTWLEVLPVSVPSDPGLARLQAGEREAIVLAQQRGADLLIVDDRPAWREATRRGLKTIGTLGVLDTAAQRRLVGFRDAVERLKRTSFQMTDAVLQPFLDRHPEQAP